MATDETMRSSETTIETNILWNRFQTTADEMYDVTKRQAFSLVIREWTDASNVVMDRHGNAVGMSKHSVPALSGALPRTTRILLDEYFDREDLSPGDVLFTNDPWIGGGHLPDLVLIEPVFYDDEVVGFIGSLGNTGDIGGHMGLWAGDAQQYYEEGLYVPPMKLYEDGEINDDLVSIIRGNVRIPDQVMGDIEAMRSANRVGIRRVQDVIDKYGLDTYEAVTEDILKLSEEAMRNEIESLEDQTVSESISFTVAGFDLEIPVSVTIDGSDIHIDYTGSSEQKPAGLNCPYASSRAFTNYVLESMTVPEINPASGLFEPLEITAPEGTILNPNRPAAVDSRHMSYYRMADVLIKAFAEILPDRAVTPTGVQQIQNFNGVDDDGNEFIGVNVATGQMSARSTKDGISSVMFPDNVQNVPMEAFEQYCPIRFEERSIASDTEGAGKYRSGFADRVVYKNPLESEVNLAVVTTTDNDRPEGLEGGKPGIVGTAESLTHDTEVPTNGRVKMAPGERMEFSTASSGGYGDPEERDPELIAEDIRKGYISEKRAREVYGYQE